jgi:hypothetical protein
MSRVNAGSECRTFARQTGAQSKRHNFLSLVLFATFRYLFIDFLWLEPVGFDRFPPSASSPSFAFFLDLRDHHVDLTQLSVTFFDLTRGFEFSLCPILSLFDSRDPIARQYHTLLVIPRNPSCVPNLVRSTTDR